MLMADAPSPRTLDSRDAVLAAFGAMRDELDAHNDRRERLVKVPLVPRSHTKVHRKFIN